MRSVDVAGKRDCKQGTLLRAACDELFRFLIRVELCFRHDGIFAGIVRIDLEVCDGRYIAALFRHDEGCDVRVIRRRCYLNRLLILVCDGPALEHIPFAGVRSQGDGLVLEDLRDVGLAVYRGCGGAHRAVIHADIHRAPISLTELRDDRHVDSGNGEPGHCPVAGLALRANDLTRIKLACGQRLTVSCDFPAEELIPGVPFGAADACGCILCLERVRTRHQIAAEGHNRHVGGGGSGFNLGTPRDQRADGLKVGLERDIRFFDRKRKGVVGLVVVDQRQSLSVGPIVKREFQHVVGVGVRDGRCGHDCPFLCLRDDVVGRGIPEDDAAHCDTGLVGLIEGGGCPRQRIARFGALFIGSPAVLAVDIRRGHGKREAVRRTVYPNVKRLGRAHRDQRHGFEILVRIGISHPDRDLVSFIEAFACAGIEH